jgi:peptidyl-prolyl cis-trans isomerase SurA
MNTEHEIKERMLRGRGGRRKLLGRIPAGKKQQGATALHRAALHKTLWLAAVGLLLATVGLPRLQAAKIVDRVVARVNNEIVTQKQYDQQLADVRTQLARDYAGPELDAKVKEQSKNLLRDMIDQDLLVEKAKDDDINVDTDVIKKLDEIRQSSKLDSLEELQKEVEKQGQVWEDFKDQIQRQLLMQEVIGREVGSQVNQSVSHQDARKYFQAHQEEFSSPGGVHLAEILISSDKHKPDELEKRAQDALAEIKAGQKWQEVVKKYSDDDDSAKEGGDVGFFKDGTLNPTIAAATAKLDTGETSDLVKTRFGYQIFKVLERRSPGIPKFEEVETRVMNTIYDQKMQGALRKYLVELRSQSYVNVAPGYLDTGAELPIETQAAQKEQ